MAIYNGHHEKKDTLRIWMFLKFKNMKNSFKIKSLPAYNEALKRIDALIAEGFENSETKKEEFLEIAIAIQSYEKKHYPLRMPATIPEMIELKMFELKIPNQKQLSEKLKISPDKLSQILTGKRKPDIEFLKEAKKTLYIDADFLLEHA